MRNSLYSVLLLLLLGVAWQAHGFGVSTSNAAFTINTDSGLVFSVRRQGLNNQLHVGDLSSLNWRGVEYQVQTVGSQINTGLSKNTQLSVDTSHGGYIVVKADDRDVGLVNYYIAKQGQPVIYIATLPTRDIGNIRWITRITRNLLPNGPGPSNLDGTNGAIESGDVFGMPNGQTRSKHYSNHRQIDWTYTGATGNGVGIWMVKGNTEGMSSGPFYRSLINQGGGQQEIYNIISYGEGQLDANRINILNLYALVFTTGATPATPDFNVLGGLGLQGWVSNDRRGRVLGVGLTPLDSAYQYVIGFANPAAQYWCVADNGQNGRFGSYNMLPGTYTMTVYKGELEVFSQQVTVTANQGTSLHTITVNDPATRAAIWRIGRWDGQPNEFMNGPQLSYMHPSDSRMRNWAATTTFNAQNVKWSDFPAVQFRGKTNPLTLTFNLNADQVASGRTLRIGITTDGNNGRPTVNINGKGLRTPSASSQPDSRMITVGDYRGRNTVFEYGMSSSQLVVGANKIELFVASGNTDPTPWLGAAYVFDCLELV